MKSDKMKSLAGMTTRQKATIGVFAVVVIIIIWQFMGLFGGGGSPTPPPKTAKPGVAGGAPPSVTPQPAQLVKQQPMSPREMELLKLQQETQEKYIAALNELQILKVSRDIAETNQAIMVAKLATVTAQKGIVDLLSPAAPAATPASFAQGLVTPVPSGTAVPAGAPTAGQPAEVKYTAISVSQLQSKWNAVLGYQTNLYHVSVGDILPPDGSKVISIDKSGVVLEKDGEKKKISLVPII